MSNKAEITEEWKSLPGFSSYSFSNLGAIKNNSKNYLFKLTPSKTGYVTVRLYDDKKSKTDHYAHCLIAKAFVPNNDNKPYVNHIDHNRSNNCATNLEWVTHQENCNKKAPRSTPISTRPVDQLTKDGKRIKTWASVKGASSALDIGTKSIWNTLRGKSKTSGGFGWKYHTEEIEGEEWKDIKINDNPAVISNKGRLKYNENHLSYGGKTACGYLSVEIDGKAIKMHQLVCKAFHKTPEDDQKYVVNHKDGNKVNNCADNLEWVTYTQNSQHAYDTGLNYERRSKAVDQLDNDGNIANTFVSLKEAAASAGVSVTTIRDKIINNRVWRDCRWKFSKPC